MNKKYEKILIMIIIVILSIIIKPNMVQAGLQANKGGTSLTNISASNFFVGIRKMETPYGTLGKSAELDTTTYLDSTKNGIDCHMILSTEFGTVAILSYSEYGMKPTMSNDVTTENETGIYQIGYGKQEYVAGIYTNYSNNKGYMSIIEKADARYNNNYDSEKPIPGDGIGKFGYSTFPSSSSRILIRGTGGVFGINAGSGASDSSVTSRAVVVCGTGL